MAMNLKDIERTADSGLRNDKPCNVSAEELKALIEGAYALKNIATQKTTEELKAEGEQEYDDADFEGGYDAIIGIARRAIQPST